jgi:hypothetical protein
MLVKRKRNYVCKDNIIDWERCRAYARRQFNHIQDKEFPEWSSLRIADLALFRAARKFHLNSDDVRYSQYKNFVYINFGNCYSLTICYRSYELYQHYKSI